MAFNDRILKILKKRLNYTDEQLKEFASNPRNESVIQKSNEAANTILVLTVVSSHGCNSQHKVGDKFFLDGLGNLLTEFCPSKVCTYALNNALLMVFAANEFIYSGISPSELKFKRCACFDAGVGCGGLGQIVLELSVITREQLEN